MQAESTLASTREERIEAMMTRHGTSLFRICVAYLKDVALAEDAVQDTFVKAYRGLDGFAARHAGSEKAWLTRIAVNTCRDYQRTAWMRHTERGVAAEDLLATRDGGLRPEETTVMEAILTLTGKEKEVLLLRYYQGFSVDEISEILRTPKVTIYSRLRRAKARLRGVLEGREADE